MKQRIFVVSILLNTVFIVVGTIIYFFFDYLSRKFAFDPLSERRTTFFDSFRITSEDVVFLGDSLTDECRWSEMFPDKPVRNRGISADQTSHLLDRLDQIVIGQPKKVFVMIGTNDLAAGVSDAEIIANYEHILDTLKTKCCNTQVFVQSILPRQTKYRVRIQALNNQLSRLTATYGYTFLDLYYDFLSSNGSIIDRYTNDELHLTGAGYEKWRDLIRPYV